MKRQVWHWQRWHLQMINVVKRPCCTIAVFSRVLGVLAVLWIQLLMASKGLQFMRWPRSRKTNVISWFYSLQHYGLCICCVSVELLGEAERVELLLEFCKGSSCMETCPRLRLDEQHRKWHYFWLNSKSFCSLFTQPDIIPADLDIYCNGGFGQVMSENTQHRLVFCMAGWGYSRCTMWQPSSGIYWS